MEAAMLAMLMSGSEAGVPAAGAALAAGMEVEV